MKFLKTFETNLKVAQKNYEKIINDKKFKLALNKVIKLLAKCIKNKGKIIFIGNGGSAADAQHLSSELVGKFLKKRKSIPAIALTTDTSIITSISNDFDYSKIFVRQIESIGNKNDILFAITTSGKSKNIIEALKICKSKKIQTVCLTKINYPKKINKLTKNIIPVPANRVDRIQELHIFIGHSICEALENKLS
tara:strand:- start:257 stop:838 length:582 start_codon:yes stop_codon:yes gene_type:complete